eukprot:EC835119.1.p3 GENE.EC835119.1~~EC835119.1.p3  ORF type:complete len:111 (-),score=21.20 EC835119.1:220-504(-)
MDAAQVGAGRAEHRKHGARGALVGWVEGHAEVLQRGQVAQHPMQGPQAEPLQGADGQRPEGAAQPPTEGGIHPAGKGGLLAPASCQRAARGQRK